MHKYMVNLYSVHRTDTAKERLVDRIGYELLDI